MILKTKCNKGKNEKCKRERKIFRRRFVILFTWIYWSPLHFLCPHQAGQVEIHSYFGGSIILDRYTIHTSGNGCNVQCAWYRVAPVWRQGIPPTQTINVAHLTKQQWVVQLLTSFALTWFGPSIKAEHQALGLLRPSIEPINFPCRADALRVMPRTRQICLNYYIQFVAVILHTYTPQNLSGSNQ